MQSATSTTSSLDDLMNAWEAKLGVLAEKSQTLDAFLDLVVYDLRSAAQNIDCPYCRRHMLLEAEEVAHVLRRTRAEGNRRHSHGLGERLKTLGSSVQIIVNVLLGGLRRAGII